MRSDDILGAASELLHRTSPAGRAQARKRRERRKQRALKLAQRGFFASLVVFVAAILWGLLISPLGFGGVMAVAGLLALAWMAVLLFSAEPEVQAEQLPQVELKALPARTEAWLERQRPALPAPANRIIDQIGVRLEGLAPCLNSLNEREPAAAEVRRLVGEELPELVRGYQRVPQALRRNGPDTQLVEGLRLVESEIGRMTEQLASGELDKLATQGKYLELKYRGTGD